MHNNSRSRGERPPFSTGPDLGLNINLNSISSLLDSKFSYQKVVNYFDEYTEGLPLMDFLSKQFNVSRAHLSMGLFLALFLFIVFGPGTEIIYKLVSLVYPALKCHKLLLQYCSGADLDDHSSEQSPSSFSNTRNKTTVLGSQHELVFWLRYWIVLAFVTFIWFFIHSVVSFIPFVTLFRIAFVLYLYHPLTTGANVVFAILVSPILSKNQFIIDVLLAFYEKILIFNSKKAPDRSKKLHFSE